MTTYKCNDWYIMRTQTVDKKLSYMPYAQAGVVENENGIHLISYTTLVCSIDKDGFLSCTGTYSASTRKHIGAFLKEYAPNMNYYNAKQCYEEGIAMNVYTGEIVNLYNN